MAWQVGGGHLSFYYHSAIESTLVVGVPSILVGGGTELSRPGNSQCLWLQDLIWYKF